MPSEYKKMLSGQRYFINDPELIEIRLQTRERVDQFNACSPRETERKTLYQREIFARVGDNVHIEKPMRIDYGINTTIGSNVFINFNFVLLDCCPVVIGDNVFIAPNVQIYTASHPFDAPSRNAHIGFAAPVIIGNNVWIGGGCIILPGVTIGDGTTVGAGSVVSKNLPPDSLAFGNPCRVARNLTGQEAEC